MKLKKLIVLCLVIVLISLLFVFPSSASSYTDYPSLSSVMRGNNYLSFSEYVQPIFADDETSMYYAYTNDESYNTKFMFNFNTTNVLGDQLDFEMVFYVPYGSTPLVLISGFDVQVGSGISRTGKTFVSYGADFEFVEYVCKIHRGFGSTVRGDFQIHIANTSNHNFIAIRSFSYKTAYDASIAVNAARDNINSTTNAARDNINNNTNNAKNEIKANQDRNASEIQANQDRNTQKTLDEEYGYEKPDSSGTDDGISAGGDLLDSLTEAVDDFNDSVNSTVNSLLDSLSDYKVAFHNIFNILPPIVQYLVVFALVFLVLRKVIGR